MLDYKVKIQDKDGNIRYEEVRACSEAYAIAHCRSMWLKEGEKIIGARLF